MKQKRQESSTTGSRKFGPNVLPALIPALLCSVLGCGSGNVATQAGPISITDPNGLITGQLTSLDVGKTAKVSMSPINDATNAGVDWAVTCGGSTFNGSTSGGACGTLAPAHTSAGGASIYTAPSTIPIGNAVTLVASVTGDSSAVSNAPLTIAALPVSVAFISPPTSVTVSTSIKLNANVLNDTTGAGVTFTVTCGSSACGSFSNSQTNSGTTSATYTAPASVPASGSVTITATSNTYPAISQPISVIIAAVSTSGPIAVSISPASFYATLQGGAHTIALTATVTNDTVTNGGVTWTLTCGSPGACGTINPGTSTNDVISATYQAPSAVPAGGTVTITATSNTSSTVYATATATITTSSVIVIKMTTSPPASLAENASATLVATANPTGQSINWTATCGSAGACGTFTPSSAQTSSGGSIKYNAPSAIPSGSVVTITAKSAASTLSNTASATTTITTPVPTIAFAQQPPSTMATTAQVPVSAAVTNDSTPPGGVTWTVSCGSTVAGGCGFVQPYHTANGATATYTAPPVVPTGTVMIVATSTSFPSVTVSSTPITIIPATNLSVSFVPSVPSQLPGYAVVNLNAAVSNDATNAGVDWQVCASGCGFFTTVAAIPAIAATPTTPYIPAVPAVTATMVKGWPNGLPISYTAPLAISPGQTVAVTAAAHVNPSASTMANIAIVDAITGPSLNGIVQAGTQPVVGASVALYAAGMSGYGSAASLLYAPGGSSYATTDSTGSFTVPGGYVCPGSNSQVYLVATGGRVGGNAANPNLALMTALGSCSNLSSISVVLNEVTTVASAWPLAPFASNNPLTGLSSYLNLGSSSSNTIGLVNAFSSVNNLVDITTGQARYTTPAGNAAVPYAEINTLADILNTCTSTTGGTYKDGTACGNVFYYAGPLTPGGLYDYTAPTDTLQAAFNIAQHPAGNLGYRIQVASLSSLASLSSPFQPILPTVASDFSISLNFTGIGGLTGSSGANFMAIDASGNVWITDTSANNVIEWNSQGAAISPSSGFTVGGITSPGPIAIDASADVWISGANGLTELYGTGTPVQGSPFSGGSNGSGMAIDGFSNIWITNGTGVMEFNYTGAELSPSTGYVNAGVAGTAPIAIDGSNNVWVGNHTSTSVAFQLAELNDTNGQLVINSVVGADLDTTQRQIAIDGAGNVWVPDSVGTQLCKMPAYGGLGTQVIPVCYSGFSVGGAGIQSIYKPRGIALDGAGNLWIGNLGGNGVTPNLSVVSPGLLSNIGESFAGFASTSLSAGPLLVAVDGSGNVWVLLSNNTLTEYVGIAMPAVTPISVAVKNKKLGKTP